jgi:hypothetical protein
MEIRKVLAHTCFQRKKGFEEDTPLSPKKCRCRQYVTVEEARVEVERGLAQYTTVFKPSRAEEDCPVCGALDPLKKTCVCCGGIGKVYVTRQIPVLGDDIIRTVSPDGKRSLKTTQVKKSPTIEKAHIERANVSDNKEEQERIEAYGESIAWNLESLGARLRQVTLGKVGKIKEVVKVLSEGTPEPKNDEKKHTGRRYDFGRAL